MKCPYCKSEMKDPPISHRMTKKQKQVYEAILSGGFNGISREKLMKKYFDGLSDVSLRSYISRLNDIIKPVKIRGLERCYFIMVGEAQDTSEPKR